MLKSYLEKILEVAGRGDAREESYYPVLSKLFEEFANSIERKEIHITQNPKKIEAGNPDFRVWDGKQRIVGYIEAKTPGTDLDKIEEAEQVKRYRTTFKNLVLTDFLEFRLYRDGFPVHRVRIADQKIIYGLKRSPLVQNAEAFESLANKFFSFSFPKITSAKGLAVELAIRTRFLRDEVIDEELRGIGKIFGYYAVFQAYLIRDLTKQQFADLYSQTITYGLFASRMRCEGEFSRKLATYDIPRTLGILKEIFDYISFGDLSPQLEWIVDDIADVLANVDVREILTQFYHEKKGMDPVFHFYETFLAEYDPEGREKRGVYYTPIHVVSYIVRSLHIILKEKFGLTDGLADKNVTVLDPAAGTLTFFAEAAKLAINEFTLKYGEGGKRSFIKEHIIENFYAFELLMAPYAIGHLKMSFLLEEEGYRLQEDERIKFYVTNALESETMEQTSLPGVTSLVEESRKAGEVKEKIPILAILGNPPYSVSSVNKSEFIEKEMELYKEGVRSERNIQPLSDDYVKFIRFAHWKIERSGKGVIGYISNNSYLSGIIHRGMREKLLDTFDEIYILNLHGSSRIGERKSESKKDENVFDIQQGVAISLFVKVGGRSATKKVYFADVLGSRVEKYAYLENNDINSTKWNEAFPKHPYYFFEREDFSEQEKFRKFVSIVDIFEKYSSGIKTHRDHFVIGFCKEEIEKNMSLFTGDSSDDEIAEILNLKNTKDFEISKARQIMREKEWAKDILPYLYRPFDKRYICYRPEIIDRDRSDIMRHFVHGNLGLVAMRQYVYDYVKIYDYVFCVIELSDTRIFISNRGAAFAFPLYLYPSGESDKRRVNLRQGIVETLNQSLHQKLGPEDIFYYIYAVLYSNIYRKEFAEFLKIDFPRVPFTSNYQLFVRASNLGKRLVGLHLMTSEELNEPVVKFQGIGNNSVEKPLYREDERRIYINKTQYFEGVKKDLWEQRIGGYQILHKWLAERKDRKLSLEEIRYYCKVVTALKRTRELQDMIDELYPDIEKEVIDFGEKDGKTSLDKYTENTANLP